MMKTTRNFTLLTDEEWCVNQGGYIITWDYYFERPIGYMRNKYYEMNILDYFGNRDGFPSVRRY